MLIWRSKSHQRWEVADEQPADKHMAIIQMNRLSLNARVIRLRLCWDWVCAKHEYGHAVETCWQVNWVDGWKVIIHSLLRYISTQMIVGARIDCSLYGVYLCVCVCAYHVKLISTILDHNSKWLTVRERDYSFKFNICFSCTFWVCYGSSWRPAFLNYGCVIRFVCLSFLYVVCSFSYLGLFITNYLLFVRDFSSGHDQMEFYESYSVDVSCALIVNWYINWLPLNNIER